MFVSNLIKYRGFWLSRFQIGFPQQTFGFFFKQDGVWNLPSLVCRLTFGAPYLSLGFFILSFGVSLQYYASGKTIYGIIFWTVGVPQIPSGKIFLPNVAFCNIHYTPRFLFTVPLLRFTEFFPLTTAPHILSVFPMPHTGFRKHCIRFRELLLRFAVLFLGLPTGPVNYAGFDSGLHDKDLGLSELSYKQ
jgi:hypothetical protein